MPNPEPRGRASRRVCGGARPREIRREKTERERESPVGLAPALAPAVDSRRHRYKSVLSPVLRARATHASRRRDPVRPHKMAAATAAWATGIGGRKMAAAFLDALGEA